MSRMKVRESRWACRQVLVEECHKDKQVESSAVRRSIILLTCECCIFLRFIKRPIRIVRYGSPCLFTSSSDRLLVFFVPLYCIISILRTLASPVWLSGSFGRFWKATLSYSLMTGYPEVFSECLYAKTMKEIQFDSSQAGGWK
jgi:hypothetical protein